MIQSANYKVAIESLNLSDMEKYFGKKYNIRVLLHKDYGPEVWKSQEPFKEKPDFDKIIYEYDGISFWKYRKNTLINSICITSGKYSLLNGISVGLKIEDILKYNKPKDQSHGYESFYYFSAGIFDLYIYEEKGLITKIILAAYGEFLIQ